MQSLKEKRLELFDKEFGYSTIDPEENEPSTNGKAGCDDCYESQKERAEHRQFLSDSIDMAYEEGKKESNCPPHHFIPHKYEGNWGGATRPPNMKCTKCLSTQYF